MWECSPPVATFRAGATTRASSAGPSSGTAIWRGVFDVRDALRLASVSSALPGRARPGAQRGVDGAWAVADMAQSFLEELSGGLVNAGAGQLQVGVIEGGEAGGNLRDAQALGLDRRKR